MRVANWILLAGCLGLAMGCHHQETSQFRFDESMSRVDGLETPVRFDFPVPSDQEVQLELVDGTRLAGTLHIYRATDHSGYAAIPVSLDFHTLSDLKAYRGTARLVIWEPVEAGVHPYAIHLEKGQSPEVLAENSGRILAILDLRRVN